MFTGINGFIQPVCLMCSGSGKFKAKCKAKQFNGPDIDYDVISIKCPSCNGTGIMESSVTAPRSRRIEK